VSVVVLVGNPRPLSRTREAAQLVAEALTGRQADLTIDLADLGPALFDRDDPRVVASPTYKASYTGLLKLFLDGLPPGALSGTTVVPLLLGGHWRHGLAADLLLKPVLVELGGTAPTRGLFLLDSDYAASEELETWLASARPQVTAALAAQSAQTAQVTA
jgi:FMN reductase